jgi:hypothetical protein
MDFEEFKNTIVIYNDLIKNKIEKFSNKYYKLNHKNNGNYKDYFIFYYDMMKVFYDLEQHCYDNFTKCDKLKLKNIKDNNKLNDCFICCCGAVHTNFEYNDFLKHIKTWRHTNFINRDETIKRVLNPEDYQDQDECENEEVNNNNYEEDEVDERRLDDEAYDNYITGQPYDYERVYRQIYM